VFIWNWGSVNRQTVLERLKNFEGHVTYMYRCTGGAVTTGVGHALLTVADATSLHWEISGLPAAPTEIVEDFNKVAAAPKGLPAAHYEPLSGCRLPENYLVTVAAADIERFERELKEKFPEWPSYPELVQEGLFDMAFNLGVAGLQKFPRFLAAVESRNWEDAAAECHRLGVSEARNQEIASLFRQAQNP
jgi:GH24 family phage-related lysozyme (muramidase)